jgi:uncharacterized protein (UPF0548 family)
LPESLIRSSGRGWYNSAEPILCRQWDAAMQPATATDATFAHRASWMRSAALGLLAWTTGLLSFPLDWAPALLLFGALVVVPLGLSLLDDTSELLRRFGLQSLLPWIQFLSALMLRAAFMFDPGPQAGALALPWLLFTGFVALLGLVRLLGGCYRSSAGLATSAGLIFVVVGGGWTVASRWGTRPMDFGEPIVLLTGVHFHYAGFALPILTGLAAETLPHVRARLAVAGVILGVPLVAVGITAGRSLHVVELSAAWFLAVACLLVVSLQAELAARSASRAERLLFALSGLALLAGMSLTAVYALGSFRESAWLEIPTMIRWHGTLNALGFTLPGLLAWHLVRFRGTELQVIVSTLGASPRLEDWEDRQIWPGVENGPARSDRQDAYEHEVGTEAPGAPQADGVHRRVAAAILRFDIFPPVLVRPVLRREPVQVGDTVGVCFRAAPGIGLLFASRVVARFDEEKSGVWRTGFTYRTLVGHPEYGEETFSVEKDMATGRVIVALRSWSRPGTVLARMFAPWVRRQQVRASRAALGHLANIAKPQPV